MKKFLIIALAALSLTACNNGENDTATYAEFATLNSVDANNCAFTVNAVETGKATTFTATTTFSPTMFKPGDRVFLNFTTDAYSQADVRHALVLAIYGTSGNGAAPTEETAENTNNWESDMVNVNTLFVAGQYLNFIGSGPFSIAGYDCNLYVDSATLDDPYPALHIVVKNRGTDISTLSILGSWSVADILANEGCKGLHVYAADPNISTYITIEKDNKKK